MESTNQQMFQTQHAQSTQLGDPQSPSLSPKAASFTHPNIAANLNADAYGSIKL